ncbi:MAG: bifunctional ADP-dependent (S)-NAD(P)H-hydrate dehydratase/NAD(P)H-hydrate epimerase [Candidatus Roseilinea sp.]|nr:MAG: bifunctional ADP-dependent (S)-NAD(P)H-hydrate dehydratase/NAD(P)H-hydrate epimerase [Candidatus Roseilinea sp.]
MEILSVAEMREVERLADAHGLSYAQMMQNAGNGAAAVILQRLSAFQVASPRVLVLVGPGNNGGDGLVCATALAKAGVTVQCYLLKPRGEDDPVHAAAHAQGIFMANAQNDMRLRVLHQMVAHANVIVDALLGTGVSRPVEGTLREVLREVAWRRRGDKGTRGQGDRETRGQGDKETRGQGDGETGRQGDLSARPLVIALDGPTGMNYDTGALDPATVSADLTITFHAPKRGHYCFPAAGACGELVVVPIGIEGLEMGDWRLLADLPSPISNLQLADDVLVRALLPSRKLDANKGTFGRVAVVGGCGDYIGAPGLAARAAYRVGAGLVALAVPEAIKPSVAAACNEAIFITLPETTDRHVPVALPRINAWLAGVKGGAALVLGPGIGQAHETGEFIAGLLDALKSGRVESKGLVCDADALNSLAHMPDWPVRLPAMTILTPHAGEMARLAQTTIAEIQSDRIGNALRYADAWGHVVVLKGAHTVIAAPGHRGVVLPFANPAMATAGTGDVLAGCIAGLLAQGLSPFDAAVCGAYLHGAAGERWRKAHGDAGMLASDLLTLLPMAQWANRRVE